MNEKTGSGRIAHIFGVYGFQGADKDRETLALTELLFQAFLCEAKALGNGQPIFVAGDFDVLPLKIPFLAVCIEQKGWVDLELAFASGHGRLTTGTCKVSWNWEGYEKGFIGCLPLGPTSVVDCWVDEDRCFEPHFSEKAFLIVARWDAWDTQVFTCTPV